MAGGIVMVEKKFIRKSSKISFTKASIIDVLKNANKNKTIRLVLRRNGTFEAVNYNSQNDISKFLEHNCLYYWDGFAKNQGYHGKNMIIDETSELIDEIYNVAKEMSLELNQKSEKLKNLVRINFSRDSISKLLNKESSNFKFRLILDKKGNISRVQYNSVEDVKEYEKLDYLCYWDDFGDSREIDEELKVVDEIFTKAREVYKNYVNRSKLFGNKEEGLPQGYIDNLRKR